MQVVLDECWLLPILLSSFPPVYCPLATTSSGCYRSCLTTSIDSALSLSAPTEAETVAVEGEGMGAAASSLLSAPDDVRRAGGGRGGLLSLASLPPHSFRGEDEGAAEGGGPAAASTAEPRSGRGRGGGFGGQGRRHEGGRGGRCRGFGQCVLATALIVAASAEVAAAVLCVVAAVEMFAAAAYSPSPPPSSWRCGRRRSWSLWPGRRPRRPLRPRHAPRRLA